MTAAEYTPEQKLLIKFFDTVIHLSPKNYGEEMAVNAKISKLLRDYPYASEVKSHISNGVVIIDRADSKITPLLGFDPSEIEGKPLSYIMQEDIDQDKLQKILTSIEKHGVSVKVNTNKCKDGSLIKTFGWIFKVGKNDYREVVMDAKHVIGYDT